MLKCAKNSAERAVVLRGTETFTRLSNYDPDEELQTKSESHVLYVQSLFHKANPQNSERTRNAEQIANAELRIKPNRSYNCSKLDLNQIVFERVQMFGSHLMTLEVLNRELIQCKDCQTRMSIKPNLGTSELMHTQRTI